MASYRRKSPGAYGARQRGPRQLPREDSRASWNVLQQGLGSERVDVEEEKEGVVDLWEVSGRIRMLIPGLGLHHRPGDFVLGLRHCLVT